MNRVFGIGLSRTGTASLAEALRLLGYRCVHFPRTLAEIEAHDAATDTSVAFIYKDLDRLYPGAKFILTTRDKTEWLDSCAWHFRERIDLDRYDEQTRQLAIALRLTLYDGIAFERERFARCYDRHMDDVVRHFAHRPSDLLTVDLCAAPAWEPLCQFLQRPVPVASFPWTNRRPPPARPGWRGRIRALLRAARRTVSISGT